MPDHLGLKRKIDSRQPLNLLLQEPLGQSFDKVEGKSACGAHAFLGSAPDLLIADAVEEVMTRPGHAFHHEFPCCRNPPFNEPGVHEQAKIVKDGQSVDTLDRQLFVAIAEAQRTDTLVTALQYQEQGTDNVWPAAGFMDIELRCSS